MDRNSIQIFKNFILQSPTSTQVFTPDGETLLVNKAWEKMWNAKFEQMMPYNILKDKQLAAEGLMPYIKRGFRGETILLPLIRYNPSLNISLPALEAKWVSAKMYPVRDNKKNITYIVLQHEDMSEDKRKDNALTESKHQLQLIMDAEPALIAYADSHYRYQWINKSYRKWFGLPENKILGHHIREVFGQTGWTQAEPYIKQALNGKKVNYEIQLRNKEGKLRWLYRMYTPDRDESGNVRGIIAYGMDITRRKHAEENLLREKFFSEAAINSLPGIMYLFNKNGEFMRWNRNLGKVSGYQDSEISKMQPTEFIADEDKVIAKNSISRVFSKGSANLEARILTKSGKKLSYFFFARRISIEKEPYLLGAAIDITVRKHLENNLTYLVKISKALSSSFEYKKNLIAIAKNAIPKIADWVILDIKTDTDMQRLAVFHKDYYKGNRNKILHKNYPRSAAVEEVFRTGKSILFSKITDETITKLAVNKKHFALIKKAGLSSAMIVPIKVREEIYGVISFGLTEPGKHYTKTDLALLEEVAFRAALAVENAQLYIDAKNAVDIRDKFMSIASHELKTPVTSLKLYIQLMQKQLKGTSNKLSTPLIKMDELIDKLNALVSDLLDVSRIQHGKLEFTMEFLDINEVIRDTVETVQTTDKSHRIIINGKSTKHVYADKYRISQVITNLLNNAVKYSPGADKVIIGITQKKDVVRISVKDFGVGIDKKDQKKIFGQFYRVENNTENQVPGLGMGLYIVDEIVKYHHGNLKIASKKGKGSVFSFSLPLEAGK